MFESLVAVSVVTLILFVVIGITARLTLGD